MSALLNMVKNAVTPTTADRLEDILAELKRHGKPRVGVYSSDGWHCTVEMNNSMAGAKFEVSSDFKHTTPTEAAIQCRDRMRAALAELTGGHK